MSSGIPSLTILSEEQKFNRESLLQWKTNMIQLLGSKGLLGYINGTIFKPTLPTESITKTTVVTTPIYSTNPTLDKWVFQDQLVRGHVVALNCTDIASLRVNATVIHWPMIHHHPMIHSYNFTHEHILKNLI